ncbi:hypothetical protein ACTXT7_002679 [Hymenolepis weldensis]
MGAWGHGWVLQWERSKISRAQGAANQALERKQIRGASLPDYISAMQLGCASKGIEPATSDFSAEHIIRCTTGAYFSIVILATEQLHFSVECTTHIQLKVFQIVNQMT